MINTLLKGNLSFWFKTTHILHMILDENLIYETYRGDPFKR